MKFLFAAAAVASFAAAECPIKGLGASAKILLSVGKIGAKIVESEGMQLCIGRATLHALTKEDFCENDTCMEVFDIISAEMGADYTPEAISDCLGMEFLKPVLAVKKDLCDLEKEDLLCYAASMKASISIKGLELTSDADACVAGPILSTVCKVDAGKCMHVEEVCPNDSSLKNAKDLVDGVVDNCIADFTSEDCKTAATNILAASEVAFEGAKDGDAELLIRQSACMFDALKASQEDIMAEIKVSLKGDLTELKNFLDLKVDMAAAKTKDNIDRSFALINALIDQDTDGIKATLAIETSAVAAAKEEQQATYTKVDADSSSASAIIPSAVLLAALATMA